MALVLYTSALLVGLDIIYFKYAQFLLDDFSETWPEVVLYNLFGVCCAVTSIHLLNLCEKIFDQTDVLPTYYSMLVLNQIFTGLVVANEIVLYGTRELALLCLGALMCILGISLLTLKGSQITQFSEPNREVDAEQMGLMEHDRSKVFYNELVKFLNSEEEPNQSGDPVDQSEHGQGPQPESNEHAQPSSALPPACPQQPNEESQD